MLTADLKLSPEQPDHRVLAAAAAVSSALFLVALADDSFVFEQ